MASRALATAFVNIVPGTKELDTYLKKGLPDDAGAAATGATAVGAEPPGIWVASMPVRFSSATGILSRSAGRMVLNWLKIIVYSVDRCCSSTSTLSAYEPICRAAQMVAFDTGYA